LCLDLEAAEEVRAALDRGRAVSIAVAIKALADPTRLLIVQALAQRELCGVISRGSVGAATSLSLIISGVCAAKGWSAAGARARWCSPR
jgi:DNA-binding transcriptional ArsR family regulator